MEQWSEIGEEYWWRESAGADHAGDWDAWETLQKILNHSEPPGYRQGRPRPRNKLGPYLPKIELILQEDMAFPRKQRHTAKRIWERLQTDGFTAATPCEGCRACVDTAAAGGVCSADPPTRRGTGGFRGGAGEDEWAVAQGGVYGDGAAL